MHKLLGLAMLLYVPAFGASLEETELSQRLSLQATEFLASLLGPDHAKVMVSVEGDRSELHTQTEIVTPVDKPITEPSLSSAYLPGYVAKKEAAPAVRQLSYTQTDQEKSSHSSLTIKRLNVSVILDTALSDAQVAAVQRVLPELLLMEIDKRGDRLIIERAAFRPRWRAFLDSHERDVFLLAGAWVVVLFLGVMFYLTAIRAVRTLVTEVAAHRNDRSGPAAARELPQDALAGELVANGIPALGDDSGAAAPDSPPVPALGRRFDFLVSLRMEDAARLVADQTPEDLALMLAYLADGTADVAASILSGLPAKQQTAVSRCLARLDVSDPERLEALEQRLKNLVELGVRGPDRLGKILSRMPALDREGLMGEISSSLPQAAEEIERSLFSFEDLGTLKGSDLRRLIMAVPYEEWGLALRGAPDDLTAKIVEQLLPGTRQALAEAVAEPKPRGKVLEARSKILTLVHSLAARGDLALGRESAAGSEMI